MNNPTESHLMADDRKFLTPVQRAALTTLYMRHPQGAILRAVTARALERKGLAQQPSKGRSLWWEISPTGLEWCEGQGW